MCPNMIKSLMLRRGPGLLVATGEEGAIVDKNAALGFLVPFPCWVVSER